LSNYKEYNSKNESSSSREVVAPVCAHECPTPQVGDDVCRALTKKTCKNCASEFPASEFYYNKTKKTYFSECKTCNKMRSKKWNQNNKRRYKANCKRHKDNNPELYREYKRAEYLRNKEKYVEYGKMYRSSKHGKGVRAALNRARELKKKNAVPPWLSTAQKKRDERNLQKLPQRLSCRPHHFFKR